MLLYNIYEFESSRDLVEVAVEEEMVESVGAIQGREQSNEARESSYNRNYETIREPFIPPYLRRNGNS